MIRRSLPLVAVCLLMSQVCSAQDPAEADKAGRRGMMNMMRGRGGAQGETAQQQVGKPIPPQEELIKKLSETLTNANLVGFFTTVGTDSERPAKEDSYNLGRVFKLPEADLWQFEAKIGFGGQDVMFPVTVAVKWAGDTPMIQLTDTLIPGMGTYSARVFLYGDRYAGTWQHGPVGGHMFGRVVKDKEKEAAAKPAADAKQ